MSYPEMFQTDGDLLASFSLNDLASGAFTGKSPYIENELYHQQKAYLSASGLVQFKRLPAIFNYAQSQPSKEETSSQRFGSLVHARALEREKFDSSIVVIEGHGNSTTVKADIKAAKDAGKMVCRSKEELHEIETMVDNFLKKEWSNQLLLGCEREQSFFARHPEFGFGIRCRADIINFKTGVVADIKTFTDLSDKPVDKQIRNMNYDLKAAFYLFVLDQLYPGRFTEFQLVFLSTEAPHPSRILKIGDATLDRAREDMHYQFIRYQTCLNTDVWPEYTDKPENFDLFFL